ncbi:MAG TPA: outer membrane protein assembly factor BamD [Verrucomicrobiae bacterium]|jgi:outer membrane assembly lipoprotein YfiO|nr:outer membrane protein assembly factor BamD [Verrucomicrobiae bacterium]
MKINKRALVLLAFLLVPSAVSNAYWVWSPEQGKFVNSEGGAQDASDEQYEYAMKLFRDKDYKKAEDEFKDLLKKYRSSKAAPEAQYQLGILYEEKGDYLKAFEAYKDLFQSYPQNNRADEVIEREFRIGNVFLSGRKGKLMGLEILPSLPRAIDVFDHIVKQAPYGAYGDKAQFNLGLADKQAGRFDAAVDAFQAVIDNYPKSELVTEARYQMAEASFMKSNVQARDQRALDNAADSMDSFLTRYPDSSVSEKAQKIRQEIDEKNAEKNYRIAVYYEKTNYLSSALIYYKDVAKRYPDTQWGQKAKEKLSSLQEPVTYHGGKKTELDQEIQVTEANLGALPKGDSVERSTLERTLERLKQKRKRLEASKKESLSSREEDLKRREKELVEKQKNLDLKRKQYASNTSEDFKKAMDRWQSSLDEERDGLAAERKQLTGWKQSLGMESKGSFLDILPFVGEQPTELDRVRQIEARKLYKVSDEKKDLLEEKELLYKHYNEVAAMLGVHEESMTGLESDQKGFYEAFQAGQEDIKSREKNLGDSEQHIKSLEKELDDKKQIFESKYGTSAWKALLSAPGKMMGSLGASTGAVGRSIDALNPFDGKSTGSDEPVQKLLEYKMHLQEKITAQKNIVDIMSQAFNEELAMQEQRRLLDSLSAGNPTDKEVRDLRKEIKGIEKEMRKAYQEINDRHDKIKAMTGELNGLLQTREKEKVPAVARAAAAPARAVLKGAHEFIFGRKSQAAQASDTAAKLPENDAYADRAKSLKEEIELESMIIEARNQEIFKLRKELDILKAKASLGGGYKFRSSIVKVPYEFMEDAVDSARSVLPKKDRKERLIHRLDEETRKLETYRQELNRVESEITAKGGAPEAPAAPAAPAEETAAQPEQTAPAAEAAPVDVEKQTLEQEIQSIAARLQNARQDFQRQNQMISHEAEALDREAEQSKGEKKWEEKKKDISGKEKNLFKELNGLKGDLGKLIQRERELEKEESEIIEKKINKIDQLVQSVGSKATAQDLLTERERLEERLVQIESRHSFLSRELDRFEPGKTKVA